MEKKVSVKTILFSLMVFFVVGCNIEVKTEIPERPSNVPENAIWIGGADGGVFVIVKKRNNVDDKMYFAKVYYISGDIAYKGLMRLHPDDSNEFDVGKKESFVGWDGDKLYLSDNRYLEVQE